MKSKCPKLKVKVGSVIRSLDFAGNDTCYIICKVVSILDDGNLYNCKAILKVWENKVDSTTRPPDFSVFREGLCFGDKQFPGRITVLA
jgi:hypothetical protein